MQNHNFKNHITSSFEDTSQHAQPTLPNLADFSACVQPALQKGWYIDFHFDEFACPDSSFTYISHWNVWFNYFIEIIIAMRGGTTAKSMIRIMICQYILLILIFFQQWVNSSAACVCSLTSRKCLTWSSFSWRRTLFLDVKHFFCLCFRKA